MVNQKRLTADDFSIIRLINALYNQKSGHSIYYLVFSFYLAADLLHRREILIFINL